MSSVTREVVSSGLDPALGFLHAPRGGRPALAFDLMEPARHVVDQWVIRLAAEARVAPTSFESDPATGACTLRPEARKPVIALWFAQEAPRAGDAARAAVHQITDFLRSWNGRDNLAPSLDAAPSDGIDIDDRF